MPEAPCNPLPALIIRPATRADLAGILALYAQPGMDDGNVLTEEQAYAIWRRFGAYPNYTLYVAEENRRVVGTFSLLIMDNLAHLGAPSAVVEDVVVSPDYQNRGIGRAMMRFALARSRDAGCYKLSLSSSLKREDAHRFYEALGFRRHGYSFVVSLD